MGFDIELITNKELAEKFMCSICLNISEAPKACSNCSNVFCEVCIRDWFHIRGKCPLMCSTRTLSLQEMSPNQMREYSLIRIRCPNSCPQVMSLFALRDHLSVCGFDRCENFDTCSSLSRFVISGRKWCSQFCCDFACARDAQQRDKSAVFALIRSFKLCRDKLRINWTWDQGYAEKKYALS